MSTRRPIRTPASIPHAKRKRLSAYITEAIGLIGLVANPRARVSELDLRRLAFIRTTLERNGIPCPSLGAVAPRPA